jgi:biotin-dependent carboxylase-like uncharacterized protein
MPALLLMRVGPGATVQDLGRPGYMHHGVPPGGPLVPELFQAANFSLGNNANDAAIEIPLSSAVVAAVDECVLSVNGIQHRLQAGETIRIPPTNEAVHYVAVPGGFDVPLVLGSRATLLAAQLGGYEGRMLRAGDVLHGLRPKPANEQPKDEAPSPDSQLPIRVVLGPDRFAEHAIDALLSTTFKLSALVDRVGQRLEGPRLPDPPGDRSGSLPMVRGAIQITTDGTPIVLGPDHPTTGGYPVIAVVVSGDLGALARRRPGSEVRFTQVS